MDKTSLQLYHRIQLTQLMQLIQRYNYEHYG
jgi:hypothetical protein